MEIGQKLAGDSLHRIAQPFYVGDDIACRYVIAHFVVDQPLEGIGRNVEAFSNGDVGSLQIVNRECRAYP